MVRPADNHLFAEGKDAYTISELADAFGVSQRTLRFYEQRGFIKPVRVGAVRRYSREDRDRLARVLQAKRLGFTLREIEVFVTASTHEELAISRSQCTEQINLLERQKRQIESALAELRAVYSSHYLRELAAKPASGQ